MMVSSPHPSPDPAAGFTIIEVLIAALIIAITMGSTTLVVAGTQTRGHRQDVRETAYTLGQRTLEQLHSDTDLQTFCAGIWKTSPTTPCTPRATYPSKGVRAPYSNVPKSPFMSRSDNGGRLFHSYVTLLPVDMPVDGLGPADADDDTADAFEATVDVTLDPAYTAGVGPLTPGVRLVGRVHRAGYIKHGAANVIVCQVAQVETGVDEENNCPPADQVSGAAVTLIPAESSGAPSVTAVSGGNGVAAFHDIAEGDYSIKSTSGGRVMWRSSPQRLRIDATDVAWATAVMTPPRTSNTQVCFHVNPVNYATESIQGGGLTSTQVIGVPPGFSVPGQYNNYFYRDSTNLAWYVFGSAEYQARFIPVAQDGNPAFKKCVSLVDPHNPGLGPLQQGWLRISFQVAADLTFKSATTTCSKFADLGNGPSEVGAIGSTAHNFSLFQVSGVPCTIDVTLNARPIPDVGYYCSGGYWTMVDTNADGIPDTNVWVCTQETWPGTSLGPYTNPAPVSSQAISPLKT